MMDSGQGADRAEARVGLSHFGWSAELEAQFQPYAAREWIPGRVTIGYGIALHVRVEHGEVWAIIPGRMRHKARSPEDVPVVGDWVALRLLKEPTAVEEPVTVADETEESNVPTRRFEAEAVVEAILPRRSRLARKAAGTAALQQVLVANVDYAWLVSALGPDFNLRRLERYIALAREGNTQPVVVLNKADLVVEEDAEMAAAAVATLAGGDFPIHVTSSRRGAGIDDLRQYLTLGKTVVLLGSSGVGKSSIVNRLLGQEVLDTQEVRNDGKGRHTTTRREIIQLPDGGLMIDTPGIRELQVWEGETGVEETFPDIEELALQCRFTNCAHTNEPGCAVTTAVAEGRMPEERLLAWEKLKEEQRLQAALREERARAEESRRARHRPLKHPRR